MGVDGNMLSVGDVMRPSTNNKGEDLTQLSTVICNDTWTSSLAVKKAIVWTVLISLIRRALFINMKKYSFFV